MVLVCSQSTASHFFLFERAGIKHALPFFECDCPFTIAIALSRWLLSRSLKLKDLSRSRYLYRGSIFSLFFKFITNTSQKNVVTLKSHEGPLNTLIFLVDFWRIFNNILIYALQDGASVTLIMRFYFLFSKSHLPGTVPEWRTLCWTRQVCMPLRIYR